jgi:ABC-type siderophore export system fused ATPase/permease subunit
MDKNELIKIAITAVVVTCAKELVTFIIKQSATVVRKLKSVATPTLKRHWRLIPIIFDLVVIGFVFWFIFSSLTDKTPATKGFAAMCSLLVLMLLTYLKELPEQLRAYVITLRTKSPNKALQATAAAPPVL